jgi:DNA-binding FadR family transcriptional regulator
MTTLQELLIPIKQQKVYNQIVEQFVSLIERGEFKPGMQLPSERDLAHQLNVSRASLREAITVMQMMGLVETISGQGTFICQKKIPPQYQTLMLSNVGESPFMILQARKALEPAIAAIAASQHTDESLGKLREIIESISKDHSAVQVVSDIFSEGDREFHLEIARMTENPILISTQEMIHFYMGQKLWTTLMRHTHFATSGRWQEAREEHDRIFEAIQARDSQVAASRVKAHLVRVEKIMSQAELISEVPGEEHSWE